MPSSNAKISTQKPKFINAIIGIFIVIILLLTILVGYLYSENISLRNRTTTVTQTVTPTTTSVIPIGNTSIQGVGTFTYFRVSNSTPNSLTFMNVTFVRWMQPDVTYSGGYCGAFQRGSTYNISSQFNWLNVTTF